MSYPPPPGRDTPPPPPPPPPYGYGPAPGAPPPPYYTPPSPRGANTSQIIWIVLGVACGLPILIAILMAVVGALIGYSAYRQATGNPSGGGKPVGVVSGNLQWRELHPATTSGGAQYGVPAIYESMLAGDFDGDGNAELLVQDM